MYAYDDAGSCTRIEAGGGSKEGDEALLMLMIWYSTEQMRQVVCKDYPLCSSGFFSHGKEVVNLLLELEDWMRIYITSECVCVTLLNGEKREDGMCYLSWEELDELLWE